MKNKNLLLVLVALSAVTLAGCDNMRDNNRYKPYEETPFFEDHSTARELVSGTVPRGFLREDKHLYEGMTETGEYVTTFPFPVTQEVLARGKERFNIYCIVCHGVIGAGDGMVVRRGFKKPPSYREERLKNMPVGYFFHVMSEGFGVMSSYKTELTPEDRWAVAAYIRTLQQIETSDTEKKA